MEQILTQIDPRLFEESPKVINTGNNRKAPLLHYQLVIREEDTDTCPSLDPRTIYHRVMAKKIFNLFLLPSGGSNLFTLHVYQKTSDSIYIFVYRVILASGFLFKK